MSDYDESLAIFGESVIMAEEKFSPTVIKHETQDVYITRSGRLPLGPFREDELAIMKLPSHALSIDSGSSRTNPSANSIKTRPGAGGELESNARLVEWEDGTWTLFVGSEHFRILPRSESVAVYDKQTEGAGDEVMVHVTNVNKQLNVIPGSLDSRTHKHLVEQTTINRKLVQNRKVALATSIATPVGGETVKFDRTPPPTGPARPKRNRPILSEEFLEEGMGASVKQIKSHFRKGRAKSRRQAEQEEEDVRFSESNSGSDLSSSDSSSGSSSSSSSGSSSSSSDSGDD
jgi:hypothetical protein